MHLPLAAKRHAVIRDRQAKQVSDPGCVHGDVDGVAVAPPVRTPWGLDFQNVYVFEHCAADGSIYKADAHACGDAKDRPFVYPPFLFAFFRWLRPLAFETTLYIWTAFVFASFAGVFYLWTRKISRASPLPEARHEVVTFCMLLLVQSPFVFAIERGNTDGVTVVLYTIAAVLPVRRKVWLAGMAAGIATGLAVARRRGHRDDRRARLGVATWAAGPGFAGAAVRSPRSR